LNRSFSKLLSKKITHLKFESHGHYVRDCNVAKLHFTGEKSYRIFLVQKLWQVYKYNDLVKALLPKPIIL